MIKRDLRVKDGDYTLAFVKVDERKRETELVEIGAGVGDGVGGQFDLEDLNDFVVILNEAAKYFGYELVMSPISIRPRRPTMEQLDEENRLANRKPSLRDLDD